VYFRRCCVQNWGFQVPVTDIPDWCYHEAGLPYGLEDRAQGAMAAEVYAKMRTASPISIVEAVKAPTMVRGGHLCLHFRRCFRLFFRLFSKMLFFPLIFSRMLGVNLFFWRDRCAYTPMVCRQSIGSRNHATTRPPLNRRC